MRGYRVRNIEFKTTPNLVSLTNVTLLCIKLNGKLMCTKLKKKKRGLQWILESPLKASYWFRRCAFFLVMAFCFMICWAFPNLVQSLFRFLNGELWFRFVRWIVFISDFLRTFGDDLLLLNTAEPRRGWLRCQPACTAYRHLVLS